METTVIERIKDVISEKKLSVLKFSKEINFPYTTLNNYVSGQRNALDINLIIKIVSTYEDISTDWILLGVGSMYKTPEEKRDISTETNNLMMKTIIELSGKNALLEEKIKTLESEKIYLKVADKETSYTKKK